MLPPAFFLFVLSNNFIFILSAVQRERLEQTLHQWQEQQAIEPGSRPDGQSLWAQYDQLTGMWGALLDCLWI